MKLCELLKFNDIVIQCHDNPDADALSSGYALYWYLEKMGKHPRFIYRGINKITKSNLILMVKCLNIPVSYEPDIKEVPELLVTVDCQYGQQNVTFTPAENVAIIDHHLVTVELPEMAEVRSNIGSCATILWDMIKEEGLDFSGDILLSTALYYGLYTDTNKLSEISHPLDRDMRDSLVINKSLITEMSNSNISLDELKIAGKAILDYLYCLKHRYLMIKADQCDPIILSVIGDFSMQTTGVEVCIAYFISPQEIKFSIRSCVKEVHANELAAFLAKGIGGGGGHFTKAGGSIIPEKLLALYNEENDDATNKNVKIEELIVDEFQKRLDDYYSMFRIIYAKDTLLDTSDMKLYEKIPQTVGCVKLTDMFPANSQLEIRTLEGDVTIRLEEDMYLMIGIGGEIYPISKEKLERSYKPTGIPYDMTFEYEPQIMDVITGEKKGVLKYATAIIATGKTKIYAKPLDSYIKLFTTWDEEKYYSGTPDDYIAVRDDDPHDIYVIDGRFFHRLYKEAE